MDPISNGTSSGANAMQAADTAQAEFDAQFDKVLNSMTQGIMSIVMEEMQQIASAEDE